MGKQKKETAVKKPSPKTRNIARKRVGADVSVVRENNRNLSEMIGSKVKPEVKTPKKKSKAKKEEDKQPDVEVMDVDELVARESQ